MLVGIVGVIREGIFGVSVSYMEWASQFGEVTIITPETKFNKDIGLLVMQGGADVDPTSYGQKPSFKLGRPNPNHEYFDNNQLVDYVNAKTPIFGICRGMQALNVYFGGTLKQHINGHPTNEEDREELVHKVSVQNAFVNFAVNSMHHQVIDKLGSDLEATAHSVEMFKKVEAIRHTSLPIAGVQWHPEEINDSYSLEVVRSILK